MLQGTYSFVYDIEMTGLRRLIVTRGKRGGRDDEYGLRYLLVRLLGVLRSTYLHLYNIF